MLGDVPRRTNRPDRVETCALRSALMMKRNCDEEISPSSVWPLWTAPRLTTLPMDSVLAHATYVV